MQDKSDLLLVVCDRRYSTAGCGFSVGADDLRNASKVRDPLCIAPTRPFCVLCARAVIASSEVIHLREQCGRDLDPIVTGQRDSCFCHYRMISTVSAGSPPLTE